MLSYVIRRLLLMVPTLLGITAVVFFVMALSPGGVGGNLVDGDGQIESAQAQALREYYDRRYGLDQPKAVQYLRWLNRVSPIGFATEASAEGETLGAFGFKVPDLGESFSKGRPVLDLYGEALPITLLLNAITTPLAYLVAIWTGTYAARYRGKAFDVVSGTGLLGLWSIPTIWAGVLMIGFFANEQYPALRLFPTSGLSSIGAESMAFLPSFGGEAGFERGWLLDRLWHLALPVICLTYGSFAVLSKLMRAAVLDNISADFVRTARAKGLSGRVVLWRHAFRNSLLPLITVAAGLIPSLLAGSLIVERIFSIPGMGQLMIEAIYARDRELVLAGTLLGGLISLICILIADLCYAVADPRVSYD
ncbi:MAG: ABC transporter permease [Planctomycetota bacterium]